MAATSPPTAKVGIYSPPTKTSRCGEDSVKTGKTGQTAHYKTGQTAQAPTAINLAVGLASGPTASINSGPTGAIGQTARGTGPTARQNRDATPNYTSSGKSLPRLNPVQPHHLSDRSTHSRSDRYHRSDRLQGRSDRQQSPRLVHLLQLNLQNTLCQLMQDVHKR